MSPRLFAVPLALALILTGGQSKACFVRAPQPVQVWLDHVRIDVVNGIATKSYECAFKNPNGGAIVGGECFMELEPGAQIDGLAVTVDGKEHSAEILTVEQANRVFTEIVRSGGSPALLEYYGNQLIRTKLPNIPAGKEVMVKLRYTMPLKKTGDLYRISCLNTNPKALAQTLKAASVTIRLKSDEPVKTVYSPSHEIELFEEAGWDVGVKWSTEDYTPVSPFVLYVKTAPGDIAASLIAHRTSKDDGTFLLILSPTQGVKASDLSADDVLPKDVVFCVDTSGSMLADGKMEQAKAALKHCVESLRPQDRFNVVAFGTAVTTFRESLVEANDDERKAALEFADDLSARGGTAMSVALEQAFSQLSERSDGDRRMAMLLFATDGLPTIGELEPKKILADAKRLNTSDIRLFAFGEGYDVNASLLDTLAREHDGEADYILPTEKIDERIARFFDRIGSPVLTDLEVTIDGLKVEDVYPSSIPDLFLGEQVMLVGRYRGQGTKTVTLTGKAAGATKTYNYEVTFPRRTDDESAEFVPRLWAGRKVDSLLTTLRGQDTPDKSLIEEVTALATRYGIVTPYTSFLLSTPLRRDQLAAGSRGAAAGRGGMARRFSHFGTAPGLEGLSEESRAVRGRLALDAAAPADSELRREQVVGAKELSLARGNALKSGNAADFYRQAGQALNEYEEDLSETKRLHDALQSVRYIGSRTFYNRGGQWQESTFKPETDKPRRQIKQGSQEYVDLLDRDVKLAKYFALGNAVLEIDGEWVEVN
ncbi:MAG: VWA domain-containing protein [Planctomycetaceae bacterium]|nr:VWA domain-containing protein [Planctomycetaceae bacterium]